MSTLYLELKNFGKSVRIYINFDHRSVLQEVVSSSCRGIREKLKETIAAEYGIKADPRIAEESENDIISDLLQIVLGQSEKKPTKSSKASGAAKSDREEPHFCFRSVRW